MGTVYSLVCFGGLSGKTVTFTDAGDVVNLTNHGLRQGVTGIVFSTTGSLPSGVVAGTTYYPRDGADANKFTIYPTKADALAGTNQRTFTGAGSGTHTVKSAYMLGLSTEQLARYGAAGNERIYSGITAWVSGRSSASPLDSEVCEIGPIWDDYVTASLQLSILSAGSTTVHTCVDGVRTEAYHKGVLHSGYRMYLKGDYIVINETGLETLIDGIHIHSGSGRTDNKGLSIATNEARNILLSADVQTRNIGLLVNTLAKVSNFIIEGFSQGISCVDYATKYFVRNGLVTKCALGIKKAPFSATAGYFYNVVSVGNTTNWDASPTGVSGANKNAGLTGEAWTVGAGTIVDITDEEPYLATFSNWANGDYSLVSDSVLVDAGTEYYGMLALDIAGTERPSYSGGASEYVDIGPMEFDKGYGLHPLQVTLAISGMAEGSVLAVYKTSDSSAIISPTTIGASGSHSITYSYTGDTQIEVVVRKGSSGTKYLPYSAPGLITNTGFSLIVNQVIDGVLNG